MPQNFQSGSEAKVVKKESHAAKHGFSFPFADSDRHFFGASIGDKKDEIGREGEISIRSAHRSSSANDIGFRVKRPFPDFGDLKRPCKIGRRFDRSRFQLWEKGDPNQAQKSPTKSGIRTLAKLAHRTFGFGACIKKSPVGHNFGLISAEG